MEKYTDEYPVCEKTYATLCIYPGELNPNYVNESLGINATKLQYAGEKVQGKLNRKHKINGWFLSSEGIVKSKDSRRHIDWIIKQIRGKEKKLMLLQQKKVKMVIICFWSSARGHGGPGLNPEQMKFLGELNLEIWYDFYP